MTVHNELPTTVLAPEAMITQVLTPYKPGVERTVAPQFHSELGYRFTPLPDDINTTFDELTVFKDSPQAFRRTEWDVELVGSWEHVLGVETPSDNAAAPTDFIRLWHGPLHSEDHALHTEVADLMTLSDDEFDAAFSAAHPATDPATEATTVVERVQEVSENSSEVVEEAELPQEVTGAVNMSDHLDDDTGFEEFGPTDQLQDLSSDAGLEATRHDIEPVAVTQVGLPVIEEEQLVVATAPEQRRSRRILALAAGIVAFSVGIAGAITAVHDRGHGPTTVAAAPAFTPNKPQAIVLPSNGATHATITIKPTETASMEPVAAVSQLPSPSASKESAVPTETPDASASPSAKATSPSAPASSESPAPTPTPTKTESTPTTQPTTPTSTPTTTPSSPSSPSASATPTGSNTPGAEEPSSTTSSAS